ncbi:MAG: hypothetical protein V4725_11435 [Bacteroidota bacterium]
MEQEINYTHEDLAGEFSVKLANGQTLDDFCADHIPEYNRDRFEALAIRLYVGAETIVTVYAVDKTRQEASSTISPGKIPVKKFKITTLKMIDILSYGAGFNFTLTTGNHAIEDMEVINK